MKKTVFSLPNGKVLQEFHMKISNPYTPINQGEQVVLTSGIYKVINVVHTPEIHRREIILEKI